MERPEMHKLVVLYPHPADTGAFERYYRATQGTLVLDYETETPPHR
ncbi:hypothetical protein NQ152_10965 [Microbacterium sp. zg.B48]|nr:MULTISPECIES: hypothetical protein [unclassified Microbacterium]MCR2764024.1 hypothetical protein [Microbacterium sp. zg.B48]MCR2810445.1 hypothetical protein [Microbacterium sp. zg.B185]WIM18497.1 hypothetical protein QNO12_12975 [Microbacterium sp. zg-B185]